MRAVGSPAPQRRNQKRAMTGNCQPDLAAMGNSVDRDCGLTVVTGIATRPGGKAGLPRNWPSNLERLETTTAPFGAKETEYPAHCGLRLAGGQVTAMGPYLQGEKGGSMR